MDSLWIVITYYLLALNSTKCLLFLMPASFLLLKEKNDIHFAGRKLEEPFFRIHFFNSGVHWAK